MSALRKLLAEIDRTLKKIDEGVVVFEDIWEKLHATDHQSQKDKYEAELKKEIKKLQRFRDSVKTWMGNSEIKDKTSLIEARKRIERKMEQFKATEKELKTKAFSKEGLSRAGADDPRAAMREWIAEACERLTSEVEICEAEIDDEYARNKKSQDLERIAQLEDSRKRNKFHVAKLELCLRCLENGGISVEDVTDIKEFVDACADNVEEALSIYGDGMDIYDHIKDQLESVARDVVGATGAPGAKDEDDSRRAEEEEKRKREKERAAAQAAKAQIAGVKVLDEPTTPSGAASAVVASTPKKNARPSTQGKDDAPGPAPKSLDGATSPAQTAQLGKVATAPGTPGKGDSGPLKQMSSPASVSGAAAASAAGTGASADVARAASVSVHDAQVQQPNSQHGSMQPPIGAGQGAGREAQDGVDSLVDSIGDLVDQGDGPRSAGLGTGTAPGQGGGPDGASASKGTGEGPGPGGPGLVPQLPPALMPTPQTARRALQILHDVFSAGVPKPQDSDWVQKPQRPKQLAQNIPPSYPTQKAPLVDQAALFERLDPEALFFAFYFQVGTYQQYLAAKELKRQSWRFHMLHQAWFQRHDCPVEITDDYERGSYVYFDYNINRDDSAEGGWCYRVKQDFKIEYSALENQL